MRKIFHLQLFQYTVLAVVFLACGSAAETTRVRSERLKIAGGAELITWFERLPKGARDVEGDSEMPILSVLNDTLSSTDPGDDRLRQVWAFTFSKPSLLQRFESAIPFLYYRVGLGDNSKPNRPKAILDMGDPSRGTGARIAMTIAQSEVINPAGSVARLTTRSYGGNLGGYRAAHISEALDVISRSGENGSANPLSDDQLELLQSRLELSSRMLGGLVSDDALPHFYEKLRTEQTENRGHNWDLLRQSAETNGLYFQPLPIDGSTNSFAMLSVSRKDLENPDRPFDNQFLKIENPFRDDRLPHWSGYSEDWSLDGGISNMIPLAIYALDYPGVPLLLVDFRRPSAARRTEMTARIADDVTSGVLGLTGFGHLGFYALKSSWLFIAKRHGGTTDRAARSRAFIQLRHALGVDRTLEPQLRNELAKRLEQLNFDPMERTWDQEVRGAWAQYHALMKYAQEPTGLSKLVRSDREQEARALAHSPGTRILMRIATVGTLGAYRHRDSLAPEELDRIADIRRQDLLKRSAVSPAPADRIRTITSEAGE